jgi:Na+/melibiose symporter-like transporter
MPEVVAVFIPIIFFIVAGLIITLALYFKSREKQMMIEKGLSTEQMFELLRTREIVKKNGYYLLKGGIIMLFLVAFGIIGNTIDRIYFFGYKYWEDGTKYWDNEPVYSVWFTFLGLGIGAIVAHFVARKVQVKESAQK